MEGGRLRVISCRVENFASYKELDFNFENQGLTLIQGATGAGKSTLCDIIPWVLFGTTAKNGAVDEIRSWDSTETTYGHLVLDMGEYSIWIARTRAPNDLYYIIDGVWEHPKRGKDLNDTQKLINTLLGIDSALYLSGAYFHEFSQTAQFFITTAKNRRTICEQLIDLSLAKNLQLKLSEQSKQLHKFEQTFLQKIQLYSDRIQQLSSVNYKDKSDNFEKDKKIKIEELSTKFNKLKLEMEKQGSKIIPLRHKINNLEFSLKDAVCAECGAKKDNETRIILLQSKQEFQYEIKEHGRMSDEIQTIDCKRGEAKRSQNIYKELEDKRMLDIKCQTLIREGFQAEFDLAQRDLSDIELLIETVNEFRGVLIKNTIQQLEDRVNGLLSAHFDAEIKVLFEVVDADKLDVTILKDGNNCSYTQLSKGQRQLLKLCFCVSVMRAVSNQHGGAFNVVFFDEALDGLDDNFKLKAFSLLKTLELEYSSIFVVEHSEALKTMFTNKYEVQLINGKSIIEKSI